MDGVEEVPTWPSHDLFPNFGYDLGMSSVADGREQDRIRHESPTEHGSPIRYSNAARATESVSRDMINVVRRPNEDTFV